MLVLRVSVEEHADVNVYVYVVNNIDVNVDLHVDVQVNVTFDICFDVEGSVGVDDDADGDVELG